MNGIEEAREEDFMEIHCQDVQSDEETLKRSLCCRYCKTREGEKLSGGFLVPIGGGKDSAVTLDILKDGGYPVYGYIINPRGGQPEYGRAGRTFRGAGDEGKTHPGWADAGTEPPRVSQRPHPIFRLGGVFLPDWSGDSGFGLCGFVQ